MADEGRKQGRIRCRLLAQETEFMGCHSWKERSLGMLKFKGSKRESGFPF